MIAKSVVEPPGAAWLPDRLVELRHLRYFCAVAETLNFSRAAERLHVSQPGLSRQIRDLETEIGVKLLLRTTTRVQLTDAGRNFHQAAEKLLTQLALATTNAQEIARGRRGEFRVASDWNLPLRAIPEAVRKFRIRHPQLTVGFSNLHFHDQMEAIRAGRIHLGFIPEVVGGSRQGLSLKPLAPSKLVAVLPSSHPLAARKILHLRELSRESWVNIETKVSSEYRSFVSKLASAAGFKPKFGRRTDTVDGALTLVAADEGVALLPIAGVPAEHTGIARVPTDCRPVSMQAIWLKAAASPLVDDFLQVLDSCVTAPPPRVARKR